MYNACVVAFFDVNVSDGSQSSSSNHDFTVSLTCDYPKG